MSSKKVQIISLLLEGSSYNEIALKVGCSKSTVSYHASKLYGSSSARGKFDWDAIKNYYEQGYSAKECKQKFNISSGAWSHALSTGKIISRHKINTLEEVMVEGSTYSRGHLKKRVLEAGLLENKCSCCGQEPSWNDKTLVLVLDHINGVYNDHRLENLRLLCPNCNSQTKTFAGRTRKYK